MRLASEKTHSDDVSVAGMSRMMRATDDSLGHTAAFRHQKSRIFSETSEFAVYISSSSWSALLPEELPVVNKSPKKSFDEVLKRLVKDSSTADAADIAPTKIHKPACN